MLIKEGLPKKQGRTVNKAETTKAEVEAEVEAEGEVEAHNPAKVE
jgi:hypothetical protein